MTHPIKITIDTSKFRKFTIFFHDGIGKESKIKISASGESSVEQAAHLHAQTYGLKVIGFVEDLEKISNTSTPIMNRTPYKVRFVSKTIYHDGRMEVWERYWQQSTPMREVDTVTEKIFIWFDKASEERHKDWWAYRKTTY